MISINDVRICIIQYDEKANPEEVEKMVYMTQVWVQPDILIMSKLLSSPRIEVDCEVLVRGKGFIWHKTK